MNVKTTDLSSTLDKQRAIAIMRYRQGRLDEALSAADEVCRLIATSPPTSYYFLDFYASAVEIYVSMVTQSPGSRELTRRVQAELKRLKRLSGTFWNVKSRYWLLKGLAAEAAGGNGRSALDRARQSAIDMGSPFDEARALAAVATLDPQAESAQDRAAELFEKLGRSYDLSQLQEGRHRPGQTSL